MRKTPNDLGVSNKTAHTVFVRMDLKGWGARLLLDGDRPFLEVLEGAVAPPLVLLLRGGGVNEVLFFEMWRSALEKF